MLRFCYSARHASACWSNCGGVFFFLAGSYLCAPRLVIVFSPSAAAGLIGLPLVHEVRFVNPFVTVSIGLIWVVIGWGLLRLRNWARWAAMIVLGIGVAWSVPVLINIGMHPGWRMLVYAIQVAVRAAAALYLAQSIAVLDAFVPNRRAV
jgi:hypothetical protein